MIKIIGSNGIANELKRLFPKHFNFSKKCEKTKRYICHGQDILFVFTYLVEIVIDIILLKNGN